MSLHDVAVGIASFKCFGTECAAIPDIRPLNLVIGRNNSGKSAILDVLQYLCRPSEIPAQQRSRGGDPEITITAPLDEPTLRRIFDQNTSGGGIPGNHWAFGSKYVGAKLTARVHPQHHSFISLNPHLALEAQYAESYSQQIAKASKNPFTEYQFVRLLADRDISPESDNAELTIQPNGRGFTNIVQAFLNKADKPNEVIEKTLLRELNRIFMPDATFSRLDVRQLASGDWEVYLEETDKGLIALSQSGSGLKTVLLVLGLLHLKPLVEKREVGSYLFALEELENNLHPALQRRLLSYIRQTAVDKQAVIFTTTHSPVAIDMFAADDKAQILHVSGMCGATAVRSPRTYVEHHGILDDLDIRASDLLQANGIVWVEGPSDRLYFNSWVSLFASNTLVEGIHYQCVFYGGRLLAHLTASDPVEASADAVSILHVNRNAILLVDSDRRAATDQLNETKQRLAAEMGRVGGVTWVTAGREIENYIPVEALRRLYSMPSLRGPEPLSDFAAYVGTVLEGEKDRFLRNKVMYAERVVPHLDRDSLESRLDLAERMKQVCDRIRKWNRLPEPS